MKELAGRLAALDPDAGAALRVIAYFDRLTEGRAGLEALVRGAAVLSGSPVRLVDEQRGVRVRVEPDGRRHDAAGAADPAWPWVPLAPGTAVPTPSAGPARARSGRAGLWLEHPGPPDGVHAMILERAAQAVRVVLDRTRGRAPSGGRTDDPALVETVLDASAPPAVRLRAAARLGLHAGQRVRAVALYGGGARVEPARGTWEQAADGPRVGLGLAVEPVRLPESWAAARTALRFTAEGTAHDPGPRIVHADDLGALALLAEAVGPDTPPIPDLLAVERAIAEAPWAAATLHAVASAASLRSAAAELTVHHSTLQERVGQMEHLLGWEVHAPRGRLRLHLALVVRRLRRTAPPAAG